MPTLANIRARVQVKINDMDSRKGSFNVIQADHAIADAAIALGAQLPAPDLYITSGLTISALADTFTLPTAAQSGYVSLTQYAGDIRIWLQARNYYLTKRTKDEMDRFRNFSTAAQVGIPTEFALWEEMDNDLQGRCYPRSREAEICDLHVALTPDDIRDAANLDAANVRFSRYGSTALVYHASALLVAQMTDEDLKLRKLNPNVAAIWQREADKLLYLEAARRHSEESVGRVQRPVSQCPSG